MLKEEKAIEDAQMASIRTCKGVREALRGELRTSIEEIRVAKKKVESSSLRMVTLKNSA
jgi:hypothetical protein